MSDRANDPKQLVSTPGPLGLFDVSGTRGDRALVEGVMLGFRAFRFRSPERNRETDERRIALIRKVVRSAVVDAEAEVTGLRARVVRARRSAIFLVSHVESGGPDPRHSAKLASLEKHLLAAEQRLDQLKDHLAFLRSIEVAATRTPR
jgi:hypothetical protein